MLINQRELILIHTPSIAKGLSETQHFSIRIQDMVVSFFLQDQVVLATLADGWLPTAFLL